MNRRTRIPATRTTRPTPTRMVENDTTRCYRHRSPLPGARHRAPSPLRYDRPGPSVAPAGPHRRAAARLEQRVTR